MKILCGIDMGGTKIEGVLLSLTDKGFDVMERYRIPTEKEKGYEHILHQIKNWSIISRKKQGSVLTNWASEPPAHWIRSVKP